LTNPDLGSITKTVTINAHPTVTTLSPLTVASNTSNVSFTIGGTSFVSGATVTMTRTGGSTKTCSVSSLSATSISCTLTSPTWGVTGNQTITVTVTNSDAGVGSKSFTVNET
jgi:hypothetical protein